MNRLLALAVVGVVFAACSGAGATGTPAGTGTPATTGTPAAAATVSTATTSLGTVLVGPNGHTLYGFTPDETAGKPTCNDSCAGTWPPLTVTGDFSVGNGLDKSKFKLVARDDGSMQLQIGQHPLYFYTPDANAGDTSGQGKGGVWFVVGADGELIQTS